MDFLWRSIFSYPIAIEHFRCLFFSSFVEPPFFLAVSSYVMHYLLFPRAVNFLSMQVLLRIVSSYSVFFPVPSAFKLEFYFTNQWIFDCSCLVTNDGIAKMVNVISQSSYGAFKFSPLPTHRLLYPVSEILTANIRTFNVIQSIRGDLFLKDITEGCKSWQIPCHRTHFIPFQWLSFTKSSHGGRSHLRLGE